MSRPLLLIVALPLFGPANLAATARGAEPDRNWAAAEPADADDDFAFQGEYLGQIRAVRGTPVPFGIQVVALGSRQFSAIGYRGGLPGNGGGSQETITWEGTRNSDTLVLKGPRGRVIVRSDVATVVDTARQAVGNLSKVRRVSRTLGAFPPVGAIILFDGSDTEQFQDGKTTAEGLLEAGPVTKMPLSDFQLHLEFKVPYMPLARDQARGNSGVYVQLRYEVQILDSFGLAPLANGCAALYRQQGPDLNMCFPPLAWQTFDIHFTAPRWDDQGQKTADARITVLHNGVRVHNDRAVATKTGAGKEEGPAQLPLRLQDHGNPVQFRNIWLVAK